MCLTALTTPTKLHGARKHARLLPIVPNHLTQQGLCSPPFPFPNSPHLCAALGIRLTHLQLGRPYIRHLVLRAGLHNPSYTVSPWSICPPLVYPHMCLGHMIAYVSWTNLTTRFHKMCILTQKERKHSFVDEKL